MPRVFRSPAGRSSLITPPAPPPPLPLPPAPPLLVLAASSPLHPTPASPAHSTARSTVRSVTAPSTAVSPAAGGAVCVVALSRPAALQSLLDSLLCAVAALHSPTAAADTADTAQLRASIASVASPLDCSSVLCAAARWQRLTGWPPLQPPSAPHRPAAADTAVLDVLRCALRSQLAACLALVQQQPALHSTQLWQLSRSSHGRLCSLLADCPRLLLLVDRQLLLSGMLATVDGDSSGAWMVRLSDGRRADGLWRAECADRDGLWLATAPLPADSGLTEKEASVAVCSWHPSLLADTALMAAHAADGSSVRSSVRPMYSLQPTDIADETRQLQLLVAPHSQLPARTLLELRRCNSVQLSESPACGSHSLVVDASMRRYHDGQRAELP